MIGCGLRSVKPDKTRSHCKLPPLNMMFPRLSDKLSIYEAAWETQMDIREIASPIVHDREGLDEFADVLLDRAPEIAASVARLQKHPEDKEIISSLFRAVHNVKGDAALTKVDIGVAIAHPIESLLSRCREGSVQFSDIMAEAILLATDRLELAVEGLIHNKSLENLHLVALVQGLEKAALAPLDLIDPACGELIENVTGFPPVITSIPPQGKTIAGATENQAIAKDLQFFRTLAMQFENRSPLFKGRTTRILRLALETNKVAGNPVDPIQLEAAVYLHDVGMMFLPEHIWLKMERMSMEEKLTLQAHPGYAADLLQRMPSWETAAQIVRQHHEMPNGSGYPSKLEDSSICPGAKIIAIVDAFEAVMLKHIHRGKNRSVLRAIAEVNACNTQFSPEWITPFNAVIRRTIETAT